MIFNQIKRCLASISGIARIKKGKTLSLKASLLKLPKSFCIAGRYSTPSSLDWQVETDTIVISSRKRYIKYAFARGVRTIRSDAIVYKDGLLHRR